MLDHPIALPEDVVHVYELRMTGIRHSMVADKYHIDDVGQVPGCEGVMYIFGKGVYLTQDSLIGDRNEVSLSFFLSERSRERAVGVIKRTSTSGDSGPVRCPAWSSEGSYAAIKAKR